MQINFARLLGFDIATEETLSAKLAAKIGPPEITSPRRTIDIHG